LADSTTWVEPRRAEEVHQPNTEAVGNGFRSLFVAAHFFLLSVRGRLRLVSIPLFVAGRRALVSTPLARFPTHFAKERLMSTARRQSTIVLVGLDALRFRRAFAMALFGAALLDAAGCDRKTPSPGSAPSTFEVPKPRAAAGRDDQDAMAPLEPGETLFGRLARDARNRPHIKPNAEDIFSTLERAGAMVPQKEQTMGNTYKASYCIGGYTADRTLAINVCEYIDDDAADAGGKLSKSLFPHMAGREVYNHKATTLTIVRLTPDGAVLERKLVDAYMAT
jgi:hypothetical protein